MRILKFIAPAAVALSLTPATFESVWAGVDPVGIWLDDTGRGAVEIKPCGNALCGNVVWVKSSTDTDGCGKQIMGDVTPVGGGHWDHGWIYSPEKGRKYDVELTPLSNGDLRVVGYAGLKFLSRTMIWKPAPADLQLCNGAAPNNSGGDKTPGATDASAPAALAPNANPDGKATNTPAIDANAATKPDSKPTADAKTPPASSDQRKTPAQETAKAGDDAPASDGNGNGGSGSDLSKMKIGDTQLDKVFTKTSDGKCKLDLPWVKVTVDCER